MDFDVENFDWFFRRIIPCNDELDSVGAIQSGSQVERLDHVAEWIFVDLWSIDVEVYRR